MTFPFPFITSAGIRKSMAHTGSASDSAGGTNNHNWGTISIGPEFPGRIIIAVATGSTGTSGRSYSSCTCGGIAGTRVYNESSGGGGNQTMAIFVFEGVTGTSAAFAAVSSNNVGNGEVGVFAMGGVESSTPVATGLDSGSKTAYSVGLTLTKPAVALGFIRGGGTTVTWTGIDDAGFIANALYACGDNILPPLLTVGANFATSASAKMVAAAWQ